MSISVTLPEINIPEGELKLMLSIKLLEEGLVSLGKAAEIAGYSEKAYVEILLHRGVSPIRYQNLNLEKEFNNA
ncbi:MULTISPECIES: UPF0175 family protein [Thermodesulfovibrio]|uniref:UPF0175 family protein n=1 Tax=Thermodesulfovibrio obliviosus TaxID=3118332 RepID=A0AAU8H538_9BACT